MGEALGGGWYALVADDDDDWRSLVSMSLRRAGFQVCEACDGEELIHRYASLSALFDKHIVLVSDIAMPGCDGVSATEWVRKASKDVPIVLVTGESNPIVLGAARDAGATRVLAKPVACATLVSVVAALCQAPGAASQDP